MTRPIYETDSDRTRQTEAAKSIEVNQGVKLIALSDKYVFDYAIVNQKEITGFMEIKVRTNPSTQYPDYLISADKMFRALLWKEQLGMNVFLCVQWTDKLGIHEIRPENDYPCRLAGRTDRGDVQDLEPCLFIPIAWFKQLCKNPPPPPP
jgi:hypothetical protein